MEMIQEVRRQFREIPSLRPALAKVKAAEDEDRELTEEEVTEVMAAAKDTEVARCVAISTQASLKRMVAPGMLALVAPVVVGLWSTSALGGLLAGTLVSGVMLAIFMSNAGGAWDKAEVSDAGLGVSRATSAHVSRKAADSATDFGAGQGRIGAPQ